MNKIKLCLVSLACLLTCGCAVSDSNTVSAATPVLNGCKFDHVTVAYAPICAPIPATEKFNLPAIVQQTIDENLALENLSGKDYRVKTFITSYRPGNTLKRSLIPGWGSMTLCLVTKVYDGSGKCVAVVRSGERLIRDGRVHSNVQVAKELATEVAGELKKLSENGVILQAR